MNNNYAPTGTNETPFNPQLQHFDFICGQVMRENHILRYVVIISCLAFFLSLGICFYAISLPESIPVLVTMDDFGRTNYVGEISRKNYQNYNIPEIAITAQIKQFIELYHTLSSDKTVMNKSVNKIYHSLTSNTASKYSTLVKEEKLYNDFGLNTKEVIFETEPLKLSKESYQVDFYVLKRTLSGVLLENISYRAVISISCLQPNDEDLKDNPLGLYITSFDFKVIENKKQ